MTRKPADCAYTVQSFQSCFRLMVACKPGAGTTRKCPAQENLFSVHGQAARLQGGTLPRLSGNSSLPAFPRGSVHLEACVWRPLALCNSPASSSGAAGMALGKGTPRNPSQEPAGGFFLSHRQELGHLSMADLLTNRMAFPV